MAQFKAFDFKVKQQFNKKYWIFFYINVIYIHEFIL